MAEKKRQQNQESAALKAAREYVNQQLEIMREYGAAPKRLSQQTYEMLVQKVLQATR